MDKLFSFIIKDIKIEISYKFSFLLKIIGIFVSLSIWYFLAKLIGKAVFPYLKCDYFSYVLIGIASSEFQNAGMRSFSDKIRQNQLTGTLEALFITPTNPFYILWGNTLWEFCYAFFHSVIFIILGVILFNIRINISSLLILIISLIIGYFAFSALGVISASFIMIFKRGDPLNFALASLSTLLAGVYYPVEILPSPLRLLSNFLPVTHFLKIMRELLLSGSPSETVMKSLIYLTTFVILLLPLSLLSFKISYEIALRKGTLSYY